MIGEFRFDEIHIYGQSEPLRDCRCKYVPGWVLVDGDLPAWYSFTAIERAHGLHLVPPALRKKKAAGLGEDQKPHEQK